MKRMNVLIIIQILVCSNWSVYALVDFQMEGYQDLYSEIGENESDLENSVLSLPVITRTPTNVTDGSSLGAVNFQGYFNTNYRLAAVVSSLVDGTPTGAIVPGALYFSTRNSSGTLTEHMRITSAGRVGVNTTTPNAKMNIEGSGSVGADSVVHIGLNSTALNSNVTSTTQSLQVDGNMYLGNYMATDKAKGQLYFASDTNFTNATDPSSVPFDTEIDPGSNFITGTNAGFVAPVTGYYLVTLFLQSTNLLSNGQFVDVRIIKNGLLNSTGTNVMTQVNRVGSANSIVATLSGLVLLTAGDAIHGTVRLLASNGTLVSGTITFLGGINGSFLSVHLLTIGGTS